MERQKEQQLIFGGLAGFLALLVLLVYVGYRVVRASVQEPSARLTDTEPPLTPPVPGDNTLPADPYEAVSPDDNRFTVELPPKFKFVHTQSSYTTDDGRTVAIHAYTAGGGVGNIDGFAVTCYESLLIKRQMDLSEEDVIEMLAKELLRKTNCTVDLHENRRRHGADVIHFEGKGFNEASQRTFWMALEGIPRFDHVYLVFVAGYSEKMLTDSRTEHFFETFDANN